MDKNGGHRSGGSDGPKVTVYERVTERITQLLQQGVVPWQRPWNAHVGPESRRRGAGFLGLQNGSVALTDDWPSGITGRFQ